VPKQPSTYDDERHTDGCDVDFTGSEPTPDSALPAARGGVAESTRPRPVGNNTSARSGSARAARSGRVARAPKRK